MYNEQIKTAPTKIVMSAYADVYNKSLLLKILDYLAGGKLKFFDFATV